MPKLVQTIFFFLQEVYELVHEQTSLLAQALLPVAATGSLAFMHHLKVPTNTVRKSLRQARVE